MHGPHQSGTWTVVHVRASGASYTVGSSGLDRYKPILYCAPCLTCRSLVGAGSRGLAAVRVGRGGAGCGFGHGGWAVVVAQKGVPAVSPGPAFCWSGPSPAWWSRSVAGCGGLRPSGSLKKDGTGWALATRFCGWCLVCWSAHGRRGRLRWTSFSLVVMLGLWYTL